MPTARSTDRRRRAPTSCRCIDPVKNTFSTIKHPYLDPQTPSTKTNTAGPSVYWGDEPIWDSHTSIHNPMIDDEGAGLVHRQDQARRESGVLQEGIGPPVGESRAAEEVPAPALDV